MLQLILTAQMAFANCELEPSVIDDIGPGESVEITRLDCEPDAACVFRLESPGSGQLIEEGENQVTFVAPSEVECEIPVVITSDCEGTEMDQSVAFNVSSNESCKLTGGGCNSPGYGWLFIAPLLFRRRRKKAV